MQTTDSKLLVVKPQNNVHKSLKFVFAIAQVFGIFPVQGVFENDVNKLGFKWFSVRVLSSIITAFVGIMISCGHVRKMITVDGYQQPQITAIMFYTCNSISCLCFIKLARDWKTIMLKWYQLDTALAQYGWPKSLDGTLKRISIVFLSLEAAEHFLIQANKLIVAVQCRGTLSKGWEHFSVNMSFPMVFDTIDYISWLGIILQFINTRMAFAWTFIDLFIILMGCALTSRFAQINNHVQELRDFKVRRLQKWKEVNEHYNKLCTFCNYLDEKLAFFILTSFLNNFYFIIFQVHASLNLFMATQLEIIYYLISSGLLVLRVVSICLYAGRVHAESKYLLDIFATTPLELYNKEAIRLIESCKYQTVGITGSKMFLITKSLILSLISGILSYELVVIQFSKKMPPKEKPSLYSMC